MRSTFSLLALISLVLIPVFRTAGAATASASFGVSVTVVDNCLISPSSMRIGSNGGASTSAARAVSVHCLRSTPYVLTLLSGRAQGSILSTHGIADTGWVLAGSTFARGNRKIGDCGPVADTNFQAESGGGFAGAMLQAARMQAEEYAATGGYADLVTVTVTY